MPISSDGVQPFKKGGQSSEVLAPGKSPSEWGGRGSVPSRKRFGRRARLLPGEERLIPPRYPIEQYCLVEWGYTLRLPIFAVRPLTTGTSC
jgi:hypothetical protein